MSRKSATSWLTTLLLTVGCVDIVGPRQIPLPDADLGAGDAATADMPVDIAGDAELDLSRDVASDLGPDVSAELRADAGPDVVADVDAFVLLDGRGSTGAVSYLWDFGNGAGWDAPRVTATANVAYHEPGRYEAVLTAYDAEGNSHTASTSVTITNPVRHDPEQSSSVTAFGDDRAAVVSPDSGELLIVERDGSSYDVSERLMTDREPRTVTSWSDDQWLVVTCRQDATVLFVRTNGTGEQRRVFLPPAAQPYGVVTSGQRIYVTLQASGELIEIEERGGVPAVTRTIEVIDDARDLAVLPDGRFLVSRWRSPAARAELAIVSADLTMVDVVTLQLDPQPSSASAIGGLPSYLGAGAVSPTADAIVVPSLQANIAQGLFRTGEPHTHATMLRAAASFLDPQTISEQFDQRIQWQNRGLASAAAFSPRGDYLYVAMRGNHAIERLDMLGGAVAAGALRDVGHAIEGLAVSDDGRWLFADAMLSRELVVYDLREFSDISEPLQRIPIPASEPLDAELLLGRRLFNDAEDPRLSADGYIACAHCHLEGDSDRRVWDLTDRGEGLRNTISLVGRGGLADGPVNWSASYDEIQDLEHAIRAGFGGQGLLDDADFNTGTRSEPLGDPKAGASVELDALAAYVTSLSAHAPSPYRKSTGELTPAAQAGALLFVSQGCATCHAEPRLTDSQFVAPGVPLLHDVGTLGPGSGSRLGGPLVGIDTPTLRGVWSAPPYLHDGSAPTVEAVLTTRNPADSHGITSTLDPTQIAQLVEYVLSVDYR